MIKVLQIADQNVPTFKELGFYTNYDDWVEEIDVYEIWKLQ